MANFEKAPVEVQEILSKPIQQLGLKLEGSPLERFVQQLYQELEAKGLKKFRPKCYLTDEWGCPNMEPASASLSTSPTPSSSASSPP